MTFSLGVPLKKETMKNSIFIPGNVPSSKNGKRWTGRRLIHSKATMRYIKESKPYYLKEKRKFRKMIKGLEKPLEIKLLFIRGSKHKFDYINPAQTVQDLMVTYGWIEDDNCQEMKPVFLDYKYDKSNPGVYIFI